MSQQWTCYKQSFSGTGTATNTVSRTSLKMGILRPDWVNTLNRHKRACTKRFDTANNCRNSKKVFVTVHLFPANNGEYVIHGKHFTIQFSNFYSVLTKKLNFTYTMYESQWNERYFHLLATMQRLSTKSLHYKHSLPSQLSVHREQLVPTSQRMDSKMKFG